MTMRKSIFILASVGCIVLCYVLGAWMGSSQGSQWDSNVLAERQALMKMIPSKSAVMSVGSRLPRTSFETLDGSFFHLDSIHANSILLIVFDPACETCANEIAQLASVASSVESNCDIYAISSSNPIDLVRYKRETDLKIPILYDRGGSLIRNAPFQAIPLNILVDSDLTVNKLVPGALLSAEMSEFFEHD